MGDTIRAFGDFGEVTNIGAPGNSVVDRELFTTWFLPRLSLLKYSTHQVQHQFFIHNIIRFRSSSYHRMSRPYKNIATPLNRCPTSHHLCCVLNHHEHSARSQNLESRFKTKMNLIACALLVAVIGDKYRDLIPFQRFHNRIQKASRKGKDIIKRITRWR